jgi:hypothetical protein
VTAGAAWGINPAMALLRQLGALMRESPQIALLVVVCVVMALATLAIVIVYGVPGAHSGG